MNVPTVKENTVSGGKHEWNCRTVYGMMSVIHARVIERHQDILGYEGFPECTEKLLNNYK